MHHFRLFGFLLGLLVASGCAGGLGAALLGSGATPPQLTDAYADLELKGGTLLVLPFEVQLTSGERDALSTWFPSQEADNAFGQIVRNGFSSSWRDESYLDAMAFGGAQQGYPMRRYGVGRMPLYRGGEPYRTDSAYARIPNAGVSLEHNSLTPEYALFIGEWTVARERRTSAAGPFTEHRSHYVPFVLWGNREGAVMARGVATKRGGGVLGDPNQSDWREETGDILEAILLVSPLSPPVGDGTAAGDMRRDRKLREYREAGN